MMCVLFLLWNVGYNNCPVFGFALRCGDNMEVALAKGQAIYNALFYSFFGVLWFWCVVPVFFPYVLCAVLASRSHCY